MRSARGSLVAEFAAELTLGTAIAIGFAFFLLDASQTVFYQQKLAFVSVQSAIFAANYTGSDVQGASQQFAAQALASMGLQAAGLKVQTTDTSLNGRPAVACKIAAGFPLLQGSYLPASIHLADTSVAMVGSSSASTFNLTIVGNGNIVNDSANVKVVVAN